MSTVQYCWRCDTDVAMLDEREWAILLPHLQRRLKQVQDFRADNGAPLDVALAAVSDDDIRAAFREITGEVANNVDAVEHHRICLYGPPCRRCGKPLRTARASFCASCGTLAETSTNLV